MAFELSNKALALLLIAAVVVSLGGTLVSLNRLKNLEAASPVTGMAASSKIAGVNVTVTSTTAINFTRAYMSFGTGIVNNTCSKCNMFTNRTELNDSYVYIDSCCSGFTFSMEQMPLNTSGLILENIGNVNVTLTMNSSNNAATFIGGTSPMFRMMVRENESMSCPGTATPYGPGKGLAATWNNTFADVPTTDTEVCSNFRPDAAADTLRIDINITIPDNSKTGLLNDLLSATATTLT